MKRQDLENGMVVETRNGNRYLVCEDKLIRDVGFIYIDEYDENLCYDDMHKPDLDIVAVYQKVHTLNDIKQTKYALWENRSLLDKVEKEYLEYVLRPFKDKITYIKLEYDLGVGVFVRVDFEDDVMNFPTFETGTMYTGLKINEKYTTKELGLWEDTH